MSLSRQVAHAFMLGVQVAATRPRHACMIAFGLLIAGITLLVLLTIPAGLNRVAGQTGLADVVMVMPRSSQVESDLTLNSEPSAVPLISTLPGVAHTRDGQPMVAPQYVVATRLRKLDGSTATAVLRGVTPMFWQVIGHAIKLGNGSLPRSGVNQLLVGAAAARRFAALETGDTITIHGTPWHVSGSFAAGGGFWESQLWTNLSALQNAYQTQGKLTSVWVKLTSPAAFDRFAAALRADPRLNSYQDLKVLRQRSYYANQTRFLDAMIGTGAATIALALGIGAILATMNALGMALAARKRQLAILRAVGFRRLALTTALLLEILAIVVVCVGIIAAFGWLLIDGREVFSSAMGPVVQFQLRVAPRTILWLLGYLLVLAGISSVWPVWSAMHAPITHALQDE